jgi:hypothetical protein
VHVDGGLPPDVPPFITCTPSQPSVTASCEPGETPIFATGGATPQPAGGSPTSFKIPVFSGGIGTAPGPTNLPVNATLICASP